MRRTRGPAGAVRSRRRSGMRSLLGSSRTWSRRRDRCGREHRAGHGGLRRLVPRSKFLRDRRSEVRLRPLETDRLELRGPRVARSPHRLDHGAGREPRRDHRNPHGAAADGRHHRLPPCDRLGRVGRHGMHGSFEAIVAEGAIDDTEDVSPVDPGHPIARRPWRGIEATSPPGCDLAKEPGLRIEHDRDPQGDHARGCGSRAHRLSLPRNRDPRQELASGGCRLVERPRAATRQNADSRRADQNRRRLRGRANREGHLIGPLHSASANRLANLGVPAPRGDRFARQMHHRVARPDETLPSARDSRIALHHLDPGIGDRRKQATGLVGSTREHDHRVAPRQSIDDEPSSEASGRTGDEDSASGRRHVATMLPVAWPPLSDARDAAVRRECPSARGT